MLQAIAAAGSERVLELPMGMPFRPAIVKAGADHLLFVVHPRETDWCVTGIRRSGDGFRLARKKVALVNNDRAIYTMSFII